MLNNHHTLNLIPCKSVKKNSIQWKWSVRKHLGNIELLLLESVRSKTPKKREIQDSAGNPPAGGSNRPNISNSTKEWIAHYPTIPTIPSLISTPQTFFISYFMSLDISMSSIFPSRIFVSCNHQEQINLIDFFDTMSSSPCFLTWNCCTQSTISRRSLCIWIKWKLSTEKQQFTPYLTLHPTQ